MWVAVAPPRVATTAPALHHAAMATKKKGRSAPDPDTFFLVSCPRVLRAMRGTCQELGGRYGVVVDDRAFVIDFVTGTVVPGAGAADVTVRLTPPQFASLATGRVELRALVRDGLVACDGDAARLENLALVLAFLEGR